MKRVTVAIASALALTVAGVAIADGWRPAGGNGVAVVEWVLGENPQRQVRAFLAAAQNGDVEGEIALWPLPERGPQDVVARLAVRRRQVADALARQRPAAFRMSQPQWWSTCCEPHVVPNAGLATVGRIDVSVGDTDPTHYIFDVRVAEPTGDLLDHVARHWVVADVYPSAESPLYLRWVASDQSGSRYVGPTYPP